MKKVIDLTLDQDFRRSEDGQIYRRIKGEIVTVNGVKYLPVYTVLSVGGFPRCGYLKATEIVSVVSPFFVSVPVYIVDTIDDINSNKLHPAVV